MKIDGKQLATQLREELRSKVTQLKEKNIIPHLSVILVGDNPDSISYIKQKQKAVDYIGAKLTLYHLNASTAETEVENLINKLSKDAKIHAVILQRPTPPQIDAVKLCALVPLKKDIDGFNENSPFTAPIALAVMKVLKEIYYVYKVKQKTPNDDFPEKLINWLQSLNIVIIGRGQTAGVPIAKMFDINKILYTVVHSKTKNITETCSQADIISSCTGSQDTIKANQIKPGSIIIGVGLHFENGKLRGDYDDEKLSAVAGFYTPTPGGTGPLNVACLAQNLVTATRIQHRG